MIVIPAPAHGFGRFEPLLLFAVLDMAVAENNVRAFAVNTSSEKSAIDVNGRAVLSSAREIEQPASEQRAGLGVLL